VCVSRKGLRWELQAASGARFGAGLGQDSSLDLTEINCIGCHIEFFPKVLIDSDLKNL